VDASFTENVDVWTAAHTVTSLVTNESRILAKAIARGRDDRGISRASWRKIATDVVRLHVSITRSVRYCVSC